MSSFARSVLFPALLLTLHCIGGVGVAHTDGILHVKGGSWKNALVTLIPEFGEPRVIERSSAHFTLDLPLQGSYILRAEHENAATKEVVFDLHVPARYTGSEFTFPFEISLEVEESGDVTSYAGPVGLVSFDAVLEDLTYITDHRLLEVATKARELGAKVKYEKPLPKQELALHVAPRAPLPVSVPDSPILMTDERTPARGPEITEPNTSPLPNAMRPASPIVFDPAQNATAVAPPASLELPTQVVEQNRTALPDISAPSPGPAGSDHRPSTVHSTYCGQQKVLEFPSMLVAIRYIPLANGNCDELRKVSHSYGDVFYFQNGRSISQWEYEQLLGH